MPGIFINPDGRIIDEISTEIDLEEISSMLQLDSRIKETPTIATLQNEDLLFFNVHCAFKGKYGFALEGEDFIFPGSGIIYQFDFEQDKLMSPRFTVQDIQRFLKWQGPEDKAWLRKLHGELSLENFHVTGASKTKIKYSPMQYLKFFNKAAMASWKRQRFPNTK